MRDDIARLPPYYRSQIKPALTYRDPKVLKSLIAELTRFRDDFADNVLYLNRHIRTYDKPGLREGREKVLAGFKKASEQSKAMASAASRVLSVLRRA